MLQKQDIDQLMAQLTTEIIGASQAAIRAQLYDVLTEFFNDSSCWTQHVPVNATTDQRLYPVSVPEGQIIRLVGVGDYTDPGAPLPVPALMPKVGELLLKHAPQTATTYLAEFVTNVSLPTNRDQYPIGPDWVLPIWHLGIFDGVCGKMFSSPNKSYTNPTSAIYHLKRFRDAIARARISKLRANTNGSQAWNFPQSFRTGNQQGGVPAYGAINERTF